MSQPEPRSGWRERTELHLEGGGHLPGASEVVDIRHKILSCTVSRRKNIAFVRGQMDLFVYYRFAGSECVRGQGAKIPWHAEVPIPDGVQGTLYAEVVDVQHDHTFDRASEQFSHVMHIVFDVWALEPGATPQASNTSLHEPLKKTLFPPDKKRLPMSPSGKSNVRPQRFPSPEEPVDEQPTTISTIPDWAREAAEELARSQQPAVADPPAWLRDRPGPPVETKEQGQFKGTYTRFGQPYDGPAPEWPRGLSFELIEKTLEGEPSDVRVLTKPTEGLGSGGSPGTLPESVQTGDAISPNPARERKANEMSWSAQDNGDTSVPDNQSVDTQQHSLAQDTSSSVSSHVNEGIETLQDAQQEVQTKDISVAQPGCVVQATPDLAIPVEITSAEITPPKPSENTEASSAVAPPVSNPEPAEAPPSQPKPAKEIIWRPFPKTNLPK